MTHRVQIWQVSGEMRMRIINLYAHTFKILRGIVGAKL